MRILQNCVRSKFQGMKTLISTYIFQMDAKRIFTRFRVQFASMHLDRLNPYSSVAFNMI